MPSILDVQKYWDSSPCFTKRSAAPRDSKQFMDETEARKFKSEPLIPKFAEYEKWAGKKVLDIGCGIGIDSVNFARAGADVTAYDISSESLNITRMRAELANVRVMRVQGNAENLGLPLICGPFDLVYAFGSIHHSPNPEKILECAKGWMKPGGTLKIMVYNRFSWKSLWILLKYGKGKFWKFSELIARHSEAQTGCPITFTYSKREIQQLVEAAGFRVTKISIDHIFPWDIEEYKQYRYTLASPWKWLPKGVHRWLEKRIGWHLLVEAVA